jgi:MFS family permease
MMFPGSLFAGRGLFVALGLADLVATSYLLGAAPGQFYESNPVARWWLDRWGWVGLASFKAATVLLALAAVGVVARRRRRVAGCILGFACGVTALVVVYSCGLAFSGRRPPDYEAQVERGRRIEEQLRSLREYGYAVVRLGEDVRTGRRSVQEAAARLAMTEQAQDPAWLATLRRQYPGRSDAERLAALLLDGLDGPLPDRVPPSWSAAPPGAGEGTRATETAANPRATGETVSFSWLFGVTSG